MLEWLRRCIWEETSSSSSSATGHDAPSGVTGRASGQQQEGRRFRLEFNPRADANVVKLYEDPSIPRFLPPEVLRQRVRHDGEPEDDPYPTGKESDEAACGGLAEQRDVVDTTARHQAASNVCSDKRTRCGEREIGSLPTSCRGADDYGGTGTGDDESPPAKRRP